MGASFGRGSGHAWTRATVAVAALALLVFAGWQAIAAPPRAEGLSLTAQFKVFDRPPTAMPPGAVRDLVAQHVGNASSNSHLAIHQEGLRVFVVGGPNTDKLCLVVYDKARTMANCANKAAEQRDGMVWLSHPKGFGLMDVYGLIRDGARNVTAGSRRAAVNSNVFVLQDVPVAVESLSVAGIRTRTLEIGPQLPAGVTVAPDAD